MTYDREKARIDRERQEKKRQAEMARLCFRLAEHLEIPPSHYFAPLDRQAAMLDALLYAVMRDNMAHDVRAGGFDRERIELALRIQKQCLDTVKAGSAVDYMNGLSAPRLTQHPPPHPPLYSKTK